MVEGSKGIKTPDLDWRQRAACYLSPQDFFPPPENGLYPDKYDKVESHEEKKSRYARAKAICADCPRILECAVDIDNWRCAEGVWAGTTPEERQNLYRRNRTVVELVQIRARK